MTQASPRLSVVLPCYNEGPGLETLVAQYDAAGRGVDFELILVDNGSKDETPAILPGLLRRFPFARSVRVEVNQGYGHGILTGLRAARGEVLAWSHADLQTDPADVFRAWDIWRQSGSPQSLLVKGRRTGRALSEKIVTWGMQTLATLLLRTPMYEINAQPKMFSRRLLDALERPPIDLNFDLYVLYAAKRRGWSVKTFPVEFPPRRHGASSWASSWRSKWRTIARSVKYLLRLAIHPIARTGAAAGPAATNRTRSAA